MSEHRDVSVHGGRHFWPHLFEPFQALGRQVAAFFSPLADAAQHAEDYRVALELPGVDEDDVSISVDGDIVTIKGEKRDTREEKGKNYYFSERSYGAFKRAFHLPRDVDKDAITAELDKGVLTVILPRRAPAAKEAKEIRINRPLVGGM